MSKNQFGNLFCVTSFGESHGPGIGVVIDGCPSEVLWDHSILDRELSRRRPGSQNSLGAPVSARNESDLPQILSGVWNGKTLGTPITLFVKNEDARSNEYTEIQHSPRRGHADDVWQDKFGHSDWRGGGRASGRETVSRVLAGAVAQMVLKAEMPQLKIQSQLLQVGPLVCNDSLESSLSLPVQELLKNAKESGESYGAKLLLTLTGMTKGIGQPIAHKLKADLASAFMSIGAVTAVELGAGVDAAHAKGTEFHGPQSSVQYGGIRGGISTGETIEFSLTLKPTSSILDVAKKGRHDPCIGIRAAPVLEAMAYLVLVDHCLWKRTDRMA